MVFTEEGKASRSKILYLIVDYGLQKLEIFPWQMTKRSELENYEAA